MYLKAVFATLGIMFAYMFLSVSAEKIEIKGDTSHLTDMQKYVTMKGGTERPFQNEYWDHKAPGIYVDVISGEALFSSTDKFSSGTGWPSFTQPIDANLVDNFEDRSFGMLRTEVKSSKSGAHLGHVFNDGPKDKGGKRYCINSAALRFIAADDLIEQGYEQYAFLFGITAPETTQESDKPMKKAPDVAQYIAVTFSADWCPNCKILEPRLQEARESLAVDTSIVFVDFDLTDKRAIRNSVLLASQLGLGEFLQKSGSNTGYTVLLERESLAPVAEITSAHSVDEITQILDGLSVQ